MMSSSHLLNEYFQVYPAQARSFLQQLRRRRSAEEVIGELEGLRSLKVLVVGEAIIDEYHYCQAMGKSPKETIVSTRFVEAETFAGGALAAANHVAGFSSRVRLVSVLGSRHSYEGFIRSSLKKNVLPKFFVRPGASTIVKRRFVDPAFLTKMFEVSFLEDGALPERLEKALLRYLSAELPRQDLVLVTDYGHGMIGPKVVDLLCRKARFLAVNTQANSANHGYNVITKYPRADYVCIDEPELRLAVRDRQGDIQKLVLSVFGKMKAKAMVVTRGHRGSMSYSRKEGFVSIPVFSEKIVDRTGAGDAYLALSALCAAAGKDMELVGFAGNAAGALHVATVCNRTPVEPVALYKFVTALLK
jgi:bifunctional ADP-heptose synthase (sugar kinase/adenylyltransferase)